MELSRMGTREQMRIGIGIHEQPRQKGKSNRLNSN